MPDTEAAVADGEILLRTDFSPMHVIDGRLLPSAIRADDLAKRGFSVDREHLVQVETIETRAVFQMEKDPEKRAEAWIAPFQCGPVRKEAFPVDGSPAFKIEYEPVEGNEAHAAIYSSERRPPSHIKVLKNLLLPHLNAGLRTLEKYKAEQAATVTVDERDQPDADICAARATDNTSSI